jgi:CRISPR/Cas system Type II protein with McrA/HNH and RuvC-like nuclease domain
VAKPLDAFDRHSARQTGRQGECRQCKTTYNAIKNQTRTSDQHREAAQKRRLYVDIAGGAQKINSHEIFHRFDGCCFRCGKHLVDENGTPIAGTYQLDHTLPAFYLWPLTTDNATLLCTEHNSEKSGKWPSEYYSNDQLRLLQAKTGLDYNLLTGQSAINPEALARLENPEVVEELLRKYATYMDELMKLRNRILKHAGFNFFAVVEGKIAKRWIEEADAKFKAAGDQ